MFKYLFLCFSLLMPVKVSAAGNFEKFYPKNTRIACMTPPPSDLPSKVANSAAAPLQGCRTTSQTNHHHNGSTTQTINITCSKKVKRDSKGNVIRESDTANGRYSSAKMRSLKVKRNRIWHSDKNNSSQACY